MAAGNNHGIKSDTKSVASVIKCTIRQNLVKKLLEDSFQNSTITNDAVNMIVEVANCIVIETCMRAAHHAQTGDSKVVSVEHVQECLPQLEPQSPLELNKHEREKHRIH